ncbi:MAG: TAXI family TRAP transporter solute-binding subunit [Burkholderiales bacterium]
MSTTQYMPTYRHTSLVNLLASTLTAFALAANAAEPVKSTSHFINILTAGTAGIYYQLGHAMSDNFAVKIEGSRPSVQATKGSVENLSLMQQNKGEVAFTQGDTLALAWLGDSEAGFKAKADKLRGIAAIYPNYVQIVATQDSGIKTLADLRGKRLSVGAQRSGTEVNTRALLRAAGMSYKDLAKIEYLPFDDSVDLMKNRLLDATLQTAGLGVPALRELANAFSIVVVEIPPEIVDKMGAPYQRAVIPKGTYRGQNIDVKSVALPNYLVTRADLSNELVYKITRAVFESTEELTRAHRAAASIRLNRALDGMPVPLHPGAERYFKENGVSK